MKLSLKITVRLLFFCPLLTASSHYPNTPVIYTNNATLLSHRKPVASPFYFQKDKNYIYLTWDDSPQQGTFNCIDAFVNNRIKASFFAVGYNVHNAQGRAAVEAITANYPQLLLCNHGWSHGFYEHYKMYYSSPDSAIGDLIKNDSFFQFKEKIVRLPGSNSWVSHGENKGPESATQVRNGLSRMGYHVIGWDMEWKANSEGKLDRGSQQLAREVENNLDNGKTNIPNTIVILSHDRYFKNPDTIDSLNKFIEILKQDPRNIFETIDHYPM